MKHPSSSLRGGAADEAIQGDGARPPDCFAELVLGLAEGKTRVLAKARVLAMTKWH